jgi:putative ABC transport system ATP-binding protein
MQITLKNLIPKPLAGTDQSGSGLWLQNQIIISPSETNLVMSPSGRGKSSLVSFLYGIRSDFDGQILFDQADIDKFSFNDWIQYRQTKLSIVFQDLRLFSSLSAFENIQLKNSITKFKTESQILEMAKTLGVEMLLPRPIITLSYGQQQRIVIIRALCQPFEWIFLDEPFSHLDKDNISKAMQLIEIEAKNQNAGILITLLQKEENVNATNQINI